MCSDLDSELHSDEFIKPGVISRAWLAYITSNGCISLEVTLAAGKAMVHDWF